MQISDKDWPDSCGVVRHRRKTRARVTQLIEDLHSAGISDRGDSMELLRAADVLCNMAMWLTVHMTYAKRVHLDGRPLSQSEFKPDPQGHTGGALNMVPAYVGYMLANLLTGKTRAWLMGQGHCVAAIEAVNVLLGNVDSEQAARYPATEQGLSRLCSDYYGFAQDAEGYPEAPLGSHVNAYTAGGIVEGGYLGFASLQYPHMPLPGQGLVAFLSDGAFEEQRGSDWSTRWWRGEDTGPVMPIMIANGRRIEQRTSTEQKGGTGWLKRHLRLQGFDPTKIDGRDPAAFAWAIIRMEQSLHKHYQDVADGAATYPVKLPYTVAETIKGFGFPGAGTNAAHNLPLPFNPADDERGMELFNRGAGALFMAGEALPSAARAFNRHEGQGRVKEKDHCLRVFDSPSPVDVPATLADTGQRISPMAQVDNWFADFATANQQLRFRVGNPDELASNRFNKTLALLKHRVNEPEQGSPEAVVGKIITALNEEVVVSAALANKQGVNLVVSYEAFAVKMLGAMRQEAIFARSMRRAGKPVNWLSVPVLLSSHTWENSKNEISHQDPTLCEAWLQEMHDVAPVFFPFDGNSASAIVRSLYRTTGRIAAVVVPKSPVDTVVSQQQVEQVLQDGAFVLPCEDTLSTGDVQIQLITIGAFQLTAAQQAAQQLREKGIVCSIVAVCEPGRFRMPRDKTEAACVHSDADIETIIAPCKQRVFISHTHADAISGVLRRLDTGPGNSHFMGYENRGGTLDIAGMQRLNCQSPTHIVQQCLRLLERR